jgi:large subunit ribosomal protein L25
MPTKFEQIKVQVREQLGSRANKRLRDQGLVPAVVYGHKEAVLPIAVNRKEVARHLDAGAHLFDLAISGKTEHVLVKEVQYDHLGIDVLHVDFSRVDLNERVEVTVPIELKGEPKGEKDGAVLQQILNTLEIECLVTEIPHSIVVDVTHMEKDSVLHLSEIKLPTGATTKQDGELIVAKVEEIKEEVTAVEPAAEGAAEPEVIGQKERDEKAAAEAAATEKK